MLDIVDRLRKSPLSSVEALELVHEAADTIVRLRASHFTNRPVFAPKDEQRIVEYYKRKSERLEEELRKCEEILGAKSWAASCHGR